MIEPNLEKQVLDRLAELAVIIDHHHQHMPEPIVEFYDNKLSAGMAHYRPYKVSFNAPMLRENLEDMLHETVAHELAHIVVYYRWDLAGRPRPRPRPHGSQWQRIMRHWFKVEPSRLHAYNTSTTNAKRQSRWAAECGCTTHHITTTKQMNIAMGKTQYFCRACSGELVLTGDRA